MTGGATVVTVWSGTSALHTVRMRNDHVTVADGEPPLRRVGHSRTFPADTTRITIGRSPSTDVQIAEDWLSRRALRLARTDAGWSAEIHNSRGTEHRTWGQAVQPLLRVDESSSERRPVVVPLRGQQHAFLFKSQRNERTVCVSVELRDPEGIEPDGDTPLAVTPHGDLITPRPDPGEPPSGEVIDKFCQVYWEYLVWPPRLRPKPARFSDFAVKIADPHTRIVRYLVERLGLTLPTHPHGVQEMLPAQLVEIGLLRFEDHALWRDPEGRITPYLTVAERFRRNQLGWE